MVKRHPSNPLITPAMVPASREGYRVQGVFNPGAALFGEEIILLLRVAENCLPKEGYVTVPYYSFSGGRPAPEILEFDLNDPGVCLKDTRGVVSDGVDYLSTMSHIRIARSRDGIHFSVDEKPFLFPRNTSESFGVEDARITKFEDTYYINYTTVSKDGFATALVSTRNFADLDYHGIIFPPQNKDVSIFPEKINGNFYALHRPTNAGFGKPSIWCSDSPDLIHWGHHQCLARPRNMTWENQKIGGGAAPIKTPEGWLEIYHGKGENQYSLFLLLLDLHNPSTVLARGKVPIMQPETDYEKSGFCPQVVFTNGIICRDNNLLTIYYGACDETVCMAETTISGLLDSLEKSGGDLK
ncbi:glycoside hydrolase family 130 protein [Fibrobacterota bacterium]